MNLRQRLLNRFPSGTSSRGFGPFRPPEPDRHSPDAERLSLVTGLLYYVSIAQLGVVGLGFLVILLTSSSNLAALIITASLALVSLLTLIGLWRRQFNLSSYIFVGGTWLANTIAIAMLGGPLHPYAASYITILIIAGFILGPQAVWITGAANIATVLLLGNLSQQNLLSTYLPNLNNSLLMLFVHLLYAGATIYLVVRTLNDFFARSRQDRQSLEESNRTVDTMRRSLEERIQERSLLFEQRATRLQAVAEIGQTISTINNPLNLLEQVVELICSRFELYHASIFLSSVTPNSPTAEWADLVAASGTAGKAILARGYRIRIGTGMVGWVILNAQPRIAQNISEAGASVEIQRIDILELAEVRSEAVFPLRVGNQIIGALSAQSDQINAFDQDLVSHLQNIANFIAIAFNNARELAATRQDLAAARQTSVQTTRDAWQTLLSARRGAAGYRFNATAQASSLGSALPLGESLAATIALSDSLQPIETESAVGTAATDDVSTASSAVLQSGQPQQLLQNGFHTLLMPVRVRDQVIGIMRFSKPASEQAGSTNSWSIEEQNTLALMLDQVSQAIEAARLYSETQRRAAREQIAGQVTARIRESLDIETVLKTAAQEVQRALNLPEVIVRLAPPQAQPLTPDSQAVTPDR